MGVRLSEHRLTTSHGDRLALVVTPTDHVRVGRERLEELRRGRAGGELDMAIVDAVRRQGLGESLVVFRGHPPGGEGSWGFADDLTDEEADELGYRLVVDQLPTYRSLVRSGVFALVHVEWGTRETRAYRSGTERLLAELEERSVPEVEGDAARIAELNADRYVLKNLTHFHDQPFEAVVRSVLLAHLGTFEAQIPHFRALISDLPPTLPPAAP